MYRAQIESPQTFVRRGANCTENQLSSLNAVSDVHDAINVVARLFPLCFAFVPSQLARSRTALAGIPVVWECVQKPCRARSGRFRDVDILAGRQVAEGSSQSG
jgi:hypothetical protein